MGQSDAKAHPERVSPDTMAFHAFGTSLENKALNASEELIAGSERDECLVTAGAARSESVAHLPAVPFTGFSA